MPLTWELRDEDREFFQHELDGFVPDKVYDVHAHLWRKSDFEGNPPEHIKIAPSEVTLEIYREHMQWILPRREVHGMHFAFPADFPNDTAAPNFWVSEQIKKDPLARGQFYVRPDDDPEWVHSQIKSLGLRGFKPFTNFLERPDPQNAEIPEYFPEWIPRLAHEEGWSVTLHLHRERSLADSSNQQWIRTYCEKYPEMTLILDHSARGFNPYHCVAGLQNLTGLHNLYVDTSVCCSPLATMACIKYLGIDHVMYGSDFYCSHIRGTNFPLGQSFMWLDESLEIPQLVADKTKPVLVGLENLRAVKAAFHILKLKDSDIEKYFWNNAAKLFELKQI